MKAYLVLENGTVFEGESFGAEGEVTGEVVFTTGMGGYLETLTDPSYYNQIILQTFPLIGNYGVIPEDFESSGIAAKGYIVKYPCANPSNFRSEGGLDEFLKKHGIVGLCGIDTRALTRIIREKGVMNGRITKAPPVDADIKETQGYSITNAVAAVSGKYTIPAAEGAAVGGGVVAGAAAEGAATEAAAGADKLKYKVALMDFGAKHNIPEMLKKRGCEVVAFGHSATAQEIMAIKPDGVMLSNGPGDPAEPANAPIVETIRALQKSGTPIFGICLGHQLLALANGYKTTKLKFGHRGGNQPVLEKQTGRAYITSQNHGYAVVADTAAFVNINDGTCEGMDYGTSFSVQFHPEARSGPQDTEFLFDRFIERIKNCTSEGK